MLKEKHEDTVITIIFDIDETLIYSRSVKTPIVRNYVKELFDEIINYSPTIELVAWTAATKNTAISNIKVINDLLNEEIFSSIIHRESCEWYLPHNNIYKKDLGKINRQKNKVLIIENTPDVISTKDIDSSIIVSNFTKKNDNCRTLISLLLLIREFYINIIIYKDLDILKIIKRSINVIKRSVETREGWVTRNTLSLDNGNFNIKDLYINLNNIKLNTSNLYECICEDGKWYPVIILSKNNDRSLTIYLRDKTFSILHSSIRIIN